MASGHQPVDDQPAGALDDHRERGRLAAAGEAVQRRHQVLLGVLERPAVNHRAGRIQHRHVMVVLAQSQPTNIWPPSGIAA
jgi:hypothetical protein